MSEYKEYRLPLGRGSLTISLTSKQKPIKDSDNESGKVSVSEGLFSPNVYEEDLIPPRKKGGYINFYDMGQVLTDGVYIDRYISLAYSTPGFEQTIVDFINSPLVTPFNNAWKTLYKKIEPVEAHKYRFALQIDGIYKQYEMGLENLTNAGLKITQDITDFILYAGFADPDGSRTYVFYSADAAGGLFNNIDTLQSNTFITLLPDPMAERQQGLTIPKNKNVSIYLNLAVFTPYGRNLNYQNGTTTTTIADLDPFVVGWVRSGFSGPPFSEPAREETRASYLNRSESFFNYVLDSQNNTRFQKFTNWRRAEVLNAYSLHTTQKTAFNTAAVLLLGNYQMTAATRTLTNYGNEVYQAIHTLANGGFFYPDLYGNWRGRSGRIDPPVTSGPISGTDVTTLSGSFALTDGDYFNGFTAVTSMLSFTMPPVLQAVVDIEGGARYYVWDIRQQGGEG